MSFVFVSTSRLKEVHYMVISFNLGLLSSLVYGFVIAFQYFNDVHKPFQSVAFISVLQLLGASASNFAGLNLLTLSN